MDKRPEPEHPVTVACHQTSPKNERVGRWSELFFCFFVATAAAWLTTLMWQPLGLAFAEEYIDLAKVLYSTGAFESLHRPPGYAAFLALVTFADQSILSGEYSSVFLLQGVIHGLTTAIIREEIGWSVSSMGPRLVALAFGLSPVPLIGAAYLHYDTLHVFLLVLTAAAGRRAFASEARLRDSFLAGAVAAILALVRPMTLPWPLLLIVLMSLVSGERRKGLASKAALLLLGFGLTLTPHTCYNFHKTGRIIPVNAQVGAALWPMTEVELSPNSTDFRWIGLWYDLGFPIAAAHFSGLSVEDDPFTSRTLETNDLFLGRSSENLLEHPLRYVRNVCRNALFFPTGNQAKVVRYFRIAQGGGRFVFGRTRQNLFIACEWVLRLAGVIGLIAALVYGKRQCLAAVSLLICLWMVHSALYLDYRYLYSQAPLWILITGMAFFAGEGFDRQTRLGRAVAAIPILMISSTLVAFVAVFF